MKTSFELAAEFRDAEGKGASRRLRRANKVPAILYGGHREPRALALDHTKLLVMLDNERFYSTILNLKEERFGELLRGHGGSLEGKRLREEWTRLGFPWGASRARPF